MLEGGQTVETKLYKSLPDLSSWSRMKEPFPLGSVLHVLTAGGPGDPTQAECISYLSIVVIEHHDQDTGSSPSQSSQGSVAADKPGPW